MEIFYGIQDLVLVPLLFTIFLAWGYSYSNSNYAGTPLQNYFNNGLLYKLLGGLSAGAIYVFFYQRGDTLFYFKRASYVTELFWRDPTSNWIMYFPEFFKSEYYRIVGFPEYYTAKANNYMVVRLASFCANFLFSSYFAVTTLFSFFGYIGAWKLYQVFYYHYPKLHKEITIFCLYLPSLVLWGSGIFKDTITFASLGILVYCINSVFVRSSYKPKYFVFGFICTYLIGVTKSYILMALLPSLVFYVVNQYSARLGSGFVRTTLFPIVLVVVGALSLVILNSLNSTFTTYNMDNMEERMEGFQRWHGKRSEQAEGSGYTLGSKATGGVGDLIQKFPLAVNVTLFRPYLWESRKPLVFLAALESLFVFYLTVTTLLKVGVFRYVGLLFSDPFVSFCFVFAIIFAFAVGLTSYNFGALVRYKIPCLPFYIATLYIARYKFAK